MNEIKVIVPNLDRRPDRWRICRDHLRHLGVPETNIVRFSSHDHRNYNAYENVLPQIERQFDDDVPRFLDNAQWDRSKSNFCWYWTWGSILQTIIHSRNCFSLLFIDDCRLLMDYEELCHNLQLLKQAYHCDIRMIQLGDAFIPEPGYPIYVLNVENAPIFQYGLAGACDYGTIYTSLGAQIHDGICNPISRHLRSLGINKTVVSKIGSFR